VAVLVSGPCALALAAAPVAGAAPVRGAAAHSSASPSPVAKLAASFAPERLGAPTTVTFALNIDPPLQATPPPLSQIDFSYPGNLGFATSGLGTASCDPTRLQAQGGQVCPANSRMGAGSATVQVTFGSQVIDEHVALELFAAPSPDGFVHLAILASGKEPVEARIVITAVLLAGHLRIDVPLVPGLPGAPDVAIKQIRASLGGPLTYYEQVHGRTIAYRPKGIGLPDSCPRGGWHLGARLAFRDGQRSQARAVIACPRRRSRHRRGA
jgi:hypothetical protein